MDICKAGENSGLECEHYGMEVIEISEFCDIENLLIVCSTWGDGEQPDNAIDLFEQVEGLNEGAIQSMKFLHFIIQHLGFRRKRCKSDS